jgi:hypothetical protein
MPSEKGFVLLIYIIFREDFVKTVSYWNRLNEIYKKSRPFGRL